MKHYPSVPRPLALLLRPSPGEAAAARALQVEG